MKPVKFLSACLSGRAGPRAVPLSPPAPPASRIRSAMAEEAISLFADLKTLRETATATSSDQSITWATCDHSEPGLYLHRERTQYLPDLDESMWYAEPMLKLVRRRIVQGDGTGIRPWIPSAGTRRW